MHIHKVLLDESPKPKKMKLHIRKKYIKKIYKILKNFIHTMYLIYLNIKKFIFQLFLKH